VVYIDGVFAYDHIACNAIHYAAPLARKLKCNLHPAVARRFHTSNAGRVSSPIFRYECNMAGVESFQSAFYLLDALTRKGILPVYFPETEEVKDLMPLLNERQTEGAKNVIAILRTRYVQLACRHPEPGFMLTQYHNDDADTGTVDLSDDEIMKIFGRLPVSANNPEINHDSNEDCGFISDNVARRA